MLYRSFLVAIANVASDLFPIPVSKSRLCIAISKESKTFSIAMYPARSRSQLLYRDFPLALTTFRRPQCCVPIYCPVSIAIMAYRWLPRDFLCDFPIALAIIVKWFPLLAFANVICCRIIALSRSEMYCDCCIIPGISRSCCIAMVIVVS